MIRDFKTRIFCREVGYASKEVDAADPLWISRIDDFFRTNAILPPDGDPTEYSAAFEAVFPRSVTAGNILMTLFALEHLPSRIESWHA